MIFTPLVSELYIEFPPSLQTLQSHLSELRVAMYSLIGSQATPWT